MIRLSFEQKQKVLLMLLQQVKDEIIYSEIKSLILSTPSIDVLNYLREIIATQIALESGKGTKAEEVRRVVLLSNQKINAIDKLLEALILFQMLETLKGDKVSRKRILKFI